MAVSFCASSSRNTNLLPSCSGDYSSCGAYRESSNKSAFLRIQPSTGLRPLHRRLAGAVRAEQGDNKGNQADRASPAGFSLPTFPDWAKWAVAGSVWLGSVPGWRRLSDLGRALVRVDKVVETVEELATKADHIAEELAGDLPEGQLKSAVLKMEKVSEQVAAKAKVFDDILDKADEVVRKLYDSTKGKDKGTAGSGNVKDVPAGME